MTKFVLQCTFVLLLSFDCFMSRLVLQQRNIKLLLINVHVISAVVLFFSHIDYENN